MKHFSLITIGFFSACISLVLTNFILYAVENRGTFGTINVVASVAPVRIIIVDDNLTIIKIISNTKEDIRPQVVKNDEDGKEIAYSEGIIEQYMQLKPILNFSKPGVVYQREERPIQNALNLGVGFFDRFNPL